MTFFISPNTFLEVAKLYVFRIKILGTLGDAQGRKVESGEIKARHDAWVWLRHTVREPVIRCTEKIIKGKKRKIVVWTFYTFQQLGQTILPNIF
jgi:hypothetical protein